MFTIEYVKNAQWSNPDFTHLLCDVKFKEFSNEFTGYGIDIRDSSDHCKEIIKGVMTGVYELSDTIKYTREEWEELQKPLVVSEDQAVVEGAEEF